MKRLLLFICAMFVGAANAEPTNTSNSFPLNELMQPDYRYLNSAIYPNTGVYDGDVAAAAQYDWDLFSPTAGNYLPANSTTITQCTAGNFCVGTTNVHYDSIDQGITACSTLGDNSYTQSAVGSSLETDCYRNCSGNVTIEHATTVTGNDYYGNGTDTCAATACEGGYHTDNNACDANVLTITWANSENPNTTCTYGGSITTPPAATITGKRFVGWAFVTPVEYIEGNGLQWIDTGIVLQNAIYDTEVMFTTLDCGIIGYNYPCVDERCRMGLGFSTAIVRNLVFGFGNNKEDGELAYRYVYGFQTGVKIHFNAAFLPLKSTLTVDGVVKSDVSGGERNHPISIFIGGINNNNTSAAGIKGRIYYAKIYNGDNVLVGDFIPVKDANGVACMYDRVSKQFFYNAGTGNFIAGPDL